MILENKLNITNQVELAKAKEKISKQKARQLFDSGDLDRVEVGTFAGLSFIHTYALAVGRLNSRKTGRREQNQKAAGRANDRLPFLVRIPDLNGGACRV